MRERVGRIWLVGLALAIICSGSGCTTQRILGPSSVDEAAPGEEFSNHGYTWYLFCGSLPVYTTTVPQLIAEVNPNNHLVHSWRATSQEDWLASLVNLLNFGGILISLNSVSVEGRFVSSR